MAERDSACGAAHMPANNLRMPAANPSAGAAACLRMLVELQGLGTITVKPDPSLGDGSDDGSRPDYPRADAIVAHAFSGFAANPGFRQALTNHLLSAFQGSVHDMALMQPDELLTADGWRGEFAAVVDTDDTPEHEVAHA